LIQNDNIRMRILFIVPYTPNPIRVRPYQFIRTLARRGHQVTLATLWENDGEQRDLHQLATLGVRIVARHLGKPRALWNSLAAVPSTTPLQARYCWHPGLAQAIGELVQNESFDAFHVEHLRGAAYGMHVKQILQRQRISIQSPISNLQPPASNLRPPIIWDSVDCISHLFAQAAAGSRSLKGRLMTRMELPRTRRYEGWLASQFDHVLITSAVDGAALESLSAPPHLFNTAPHHSPISVLPNGVDLEYFTPGGGDRRPATLVVTGKMSYHANITMVLHLINDIMPAVWQQRSDVQVWIVGKDPAASICRLDLDWAQNRSLDALLSATTPVVVTGTVDDIRPFLQQATIAVAPVAYGAGIQNKVLEAMACGAAVVASTQAISAVDVVPGRDVVVAEKPDEFASAVLMLLAQPEQRQELAKAGRAYVMRNHAWEAVTSELELIYRGKSFQHRAEIK
jgi:glycosyltransferase involved in cell wall biosynthesis